MAKLGVEAAATCRRSREAEVIRAGAAGAAGADGVETAAGTGGDEVATIEAVLALAAGGVETVDGSLRASRISLSPTVPTVFRTEAKSATPVAAAVLAKGEDPLIVMPAEAEKPMLVAEALPGRGVLLAPGRRTGTGRRLGAGAPGAPLSSKPLSCLSCSRLILPTSGSTT